MNWKSKLPVLGLLVSLHVTRASGQMCIKCPTDAQSGVSPGTAFDVFVNRRGSLIRVSGQSVGACEALVLNGTVSYNPNGTGGGVGAGFTAGTGHYILAKRGGVPVAQLISDCTPANMGTTLVVPIGAPNSCPPVGGTTQTYVKDMKPATYTLTQADMDAGSLQFEFEYTNATVLSPNLQGQCIDRVSATVEVNLFIAVPPTCTVSPPTNLVCADSPASFTVTASGSGPFTYSWSGQNGFSSTDKTITITNAQAVNAGLYTATVTDLFGCSTTSSGTLMLIPRFTNTIIAGSGLILSGSGGTSNGAYTVLSASNLTASTSNWIPIGSNNFGPDGQFAFTNHLNTNEHERFFRLRIP